MLVMLMEVLRRQDVRYDRHSGVQPNPHQPTDHSVGDELVPVNTAIDDKPGSNDRGITPAFGELQCVQRNFQRSGLSPRPENAVGLCNGLAVLAMSAALEFGPVAVVSPLIVGYPLVTLLLSRAFLEKEVAS